MSEATAAGPDIVFVALLFTVLSASLIKSAIATLKERGIWNLLWRAKR